MLKDAGRKADVAVFSTRERAQEMAALVGAEDEQDSDFPVSGARGNDYNDHFWGQEGHF